MTVEERMGKRKYLATKEFIKEVKDLGLEVNTQNKEGMVIYNSNGMPVAYVFYTKMYHFDINFSDFDELPENLKSKLYKLICDYAGTPIYERKELPQFYLEFKLRKKQSLANFLNRNMTLDSFELNGNCNLNEFHQFTQEEIDEMKERSNTNLDDFEQIPIEEVDKVFGMTTIKGKTENKPIGWSM